MAAGNLAPAVVGAFSGLAPKGGASWSDIRTGKITTPTIDALPTPVDKWLLDRLYARKQQVASMRGRASTFLTGPRGIGAGLPTSEIATAFLRASVDAGATYDTVSDTTAAREAAMAAKATASAQPGKTPGGRTIVPFKAADTTSPRVPITAFTGRRRFGGM